MDHLAVEFRKRGKRCIEDVTNGISTYVFERGMAMKRTQADEEHETHGTALSELHG